MHTCCIINGVRIINGNGRKHEEIQKREPCQEEEVVFQLAIVDIFAQPIRVRRNDLDNNTRQESTKP